MQPARGESDFSALESLLTSRFSCRAFRSTQIDSVTLERIFSLAQRTPSWCNTQPWQVTLVEGEHLSTLTGRMMARLSEGIQGWDFSPPAGYHGIYQDRRRAAGFALYESVGIARDDSEARAKQGTKNFEFFGAPHVAIITVDADLGVYGAVDVGAYIMAIMLAAESIGIATIAQAGIAMHATFLREQLGIGDDRKLVASVSLGFADEDDPVNAFRTERESDLASVLHRWIPNESEHRRVK